MKAIKFIAVAALLAVSTAASAQFTSSSKSSYSASSTDGWSTFYLQWNPSSISPDKGDSESFTGFSVGYSKAFGLSQGLPLFIEAGIGLQYSFKNEDIAEDVADILGVDEDDVLDICDPKEKFSMFSLKVPVNLVYNWQIPNSSVALAPFVGVTLRYNLSGKNKMEWNLDSDVEKELKDDYEYYYGDEGDEMFEEDFGDKDVNLFDKDDMGSKDATWKRFQIGWQIGVNARINNKFLVGLSYGSDFSEIFKKAKIKTTSITLGYCF